MSDTRVLPCISVASQVCPACGDEDGDLRDAQIYDTDSGMGGMWIEMEMSCDECGAKWIECFYHNSTRHGDWITEGGDGVWHNLTTGEKR